MLWVRTVTRTVSSDKNYVMMSLTKVKQLVLTLFYFNIFWHFFCFVFCASRSWQEALDATGCWCDAAALHHSAHLLPASRLCQEWVLSLFFNYLLLVGHSSNGWRRLWFLCFLYGYHTVIKYVLSDSNICRICLWHLPQRLLSFASKTKSFLLNLEIIHTVRLCSQTHISSSCRQRNPRQWRDKWPWTVRLLCSLTCLHLIFWLLQNGCGAGVMVDLLRVSVFYLLLKIYDGAFRALLKSHQVFFLVPTKKSWWFPCCSKSMKLNMTQSK